MPHALRRNDYHRCAGTAREATQPDLIFLAVPFFVLPDLTGPTDWSGKIVVDMTNQFATANL